MILYEFKQPFNNQRIVWKDGIAGATGDRHVKPGYYIGKPYYIKGKQQGVSRLMQQATRVWLEKNDGTVVCLKDRHSHPNDNKVDMKEFLWMKLQAKTI